MGRWGDRGDGEMGRWRDSVQKNFITAVITINLSTERVKYDHCSLFPVPCSLKPRNLYLTQLKIALQVSPAWYELRTKGPERTWANPISRAIAPSSSNSSGVQYFCTGRCWREGRIY